MQDGAETVRVVMVTGPSGAGRSTAINALEDLGFEAIDNLPLSLIPRLLDGPPLPRPLALGLDVRNRDFSSEALIELVDRLHRLPGVAADLLYLDCDADTLVRRFSETRRRHPLSPEDSPVTGVAHELELLTPVRDRADVLIETGSLTPHNLRAEIARWFAPRSGRPMTLSVQSFSYKRGLPRGVDMVFDCRFLANPHWVEDLRALDGRDPAVAAHVESDPRFDDFFRRVHELIASLLDAFVDEGKTSLTIAFGCTGGKHRSVALAEKMARTLADQGWRVAKRHRELERRGFGRAPSGQG
ncbi:MAG: RNase adapter RapZ [Rhodobacter sp.]|uniref:RNase adapter RapZ n=1 Tax=Pararhodobacter sp. TaxID=2127056 RepID=UPI001D63D4C4|nr:RNase adapter RapZ [Pararhodobacter sp.]MCB1345312.1 RNase adapter RapZ [Paracoccaceae bacterium]MCB1408170.1 RNase adapter RapZ [Paracoccaceae bacterium]MCC0072541.1 RNase adapter RapZ [Rhodobacter sp.]HPD93005.1 RNase adapter RapZ [Pararhodobacter sp.]